MRRVGSPRPAHNSDDATRTPRKARSPGPAQERGAKPEADPGPEPEADPGPKPEADPGPVDATGVKVPPKWRPMFGKPSPSLAPLVAQLEKRLGVPFWVIVQSGHGPHGIIDTPLLRQLEADKKLRDAKAVGVLLHSPGGNARTAYKLARMFGRDGRDYVVVVPSWAKSAATLMSLGAKRIILVDQAELGPIDAQLVDMDKEMPMSALDEVQSLERLHAFALDALDQMMTLMLPRTGKSVDKLLPRCTAFVADLTRPLFSGIDVVHYTQMSRILKVAEAYAVRLLEPRLRDAAEVVARRLVAGYPDHEFVIDCDEARSLGLASVDPGKDVADVVREISRILPETNIAVGRFEKATDAATSPSK